MVSELLKIDEEFLDELISLGGEGIKRCYQCGSCTATCPLSEDGIIPLRKMIKYSQLGLKEKILENLTPWTCYYCGECSDTCPKDADPGEVMMALRRYLTTEYDWTGISKRIYHSKTFEVMASLVLALLTLGLIYLLHGPVVTDKVDLETFSPVRTVEIGGHVILVVLSALVISNLYRMYKFTVGDSAKRVPLSRKLSEFFKTVPVHFLTQLRFRKCGNRIPWIKHLILVSGYASAFILFAILLRWTLTNEIYPITNPLRILGYYSSAALIYVSLDGIIGRIRKRERMHLHSHSTDWMFLILLLLVGLTGLLVHLFKYLGMAMPTYLSYSIHLALVPPLLVLEVPFAKWAHIAYRPFAIYFQKLKELGEGGV